MTLDSSEKVYQADLMHVTPMADALIYGYEGDWILAGLDCEITASGIEIQPGRAIIQGHLYTLDSTKIIPLTTGKSGFVGWSIDLTKDNSATGADVTNNQYTFGFFTEPPAGDTLNGDTQATVAFAKVTASGSSWNLGGSWYTSPAESIRPYYETQTVQAPFTGCELSGTITGSVTVTRFGHNGRLYIQADGVSGLQGSYKKLVGSGTFRDSLLPRGHNYSMARTRWGMLSIGWYVSGNENSGSVMTFGGLGSSSSTGTVYPWSDSHKSANNESIYLTHEYQC